MKRMLIVIIVLMFPNICYALDVNDYLIVNDIGKYKQITGGGKSGSVLAGAYHFGADHADHAYGIAYINDEDEIWIDVQVTQHAGADSDQWLLHEVERGFRDVDDLESKLDDDSMIREIDGNKIFFYGGGR